MLSKGWLDAAEATGQQEGHALQGNAANGTKALACGTSFLSSALMPGVLGRSGSLYSLIVRAMVMRGCTHPQPVVRPDLE